MSLAAGAVAAYLSLSLGVYGLLLLVAFLGITVALLRQPSVALAGTLCGFGGLLALSTLVAASGCAAFNSATTSCRAVGATEALVIGAVILLAGIALSARLATSLPSRG